MTRIKEILLLFLISLSMISKAQVSFVQYKNWDLLLSEANQHKKKIFIFFSAPWCIPCKEIEKNMFTDSSIYTILNSSSINIYVNIDDSSMASLTEKYRTTAIPAIVLLNQEGYTIERSHELPAVNKNDFRLLLINMFDKKEIIRGINNKLMLPYPDFYHNYFLLRPRVAPSQNQVNDYLSSKGDIYSEVKWSVLSTFSKDPGTLEYIINNYDTLVSLYGKEVKEKIDVNYWKSFSYLVKQKDSASFSRLINIVSKFWADQNNEKGKEKLGVYIQWTQFLGKTALDWPRFRALVADYRSTYGENKNLSFCEVMYQTCFDSITCDYMSTVMESVVRAKNSPKNNIIYATLLFKANKKELADEYFSKAIELCRNDEEREVCKNEINKIKSSSESKL